MDEATKQAVLSLIRTILLTAGGVLTTKGVVDSETVSTIIGAAMVILPAGWGIWDKFHAVKVADQREATALNAGIALSNQTPTPTPLVAPEDAKRVIEEIAPTVQPTEGTKP